MNIPWPIQSLISALKKKEKRSSRWPALEREFRRSFPSCAACGSKRLLNVHHVRPVHLFPFLELDWNNLITLCMWKGLCHLKIGHNGNWKDWNPTVRQDAYMELEKTNGRNKVVDLPHR